MQFMKTNCLDVLQFCSVACIVVISDLVRDMFQLARDVCLVCAICTSASVVRPAVPPGASLRPVPLRISDSTQPIARFVTYILRGFP